MLTAVYCENGHLNGTLEDWDTLETTQWGIKKLCSECGAKNIQACPHCGERTKVWSSHDERPAYCGNDECGKPFPWTKEEDARPATA